MTTFVQGNKGRGYVWQGAIAGAIFMAAFSASAADSDEARPSNHTQAAAHFDRAVEHFRAADFEAATRAFLLADQLQPDGDTLSNALNSAKRSGSHLLVALVSNRAIAAHQEDQALVRLARSALASALPHLGRLELSCAPAPCEIVLDEEVVVAGRHLVDPGSHRLRARFPKLGEGEQVEQVIQLSAGTAYVFRLEPKPEEEDRASPDAPLAAPSREVPPPPDSAGFWQARGDEVVFASGISATAIFTGLLVWSGTDALRARSSMDDEPTREERAKVQAKIRRTDVLLGATLVTAAFSAVWGTLATDFRGEAPEPELAISSSGGWIGIRGHFR